MATSLDVKLASDLDSELALDMALVRAFSLSLQLLERPELEEMLEFGFALDLERRFPITDRLRQALYDLKKEMPNPAEGITSLQTWWQTEGRDWALVTS